jgi:hypothetical protein
VPTWCGRAANHILLSRCDRSPDLNLDTEGQLVRSGWGNAPHLGVFAFALAFASALALAPAPSSAPVEKAKGLTV